MHCMLMDLLHGFEVLSTTEETLINYIDLYETKSNTAFEGRQLVFSLLYSSKKAKTLSLTENFDFTEACGPIQA